MPQVAQFSTYDPDAPQPSIRARLPAPMLEAVDIAASRSGMNRSSTIRELIAQGLARRGLWPPAGPSAARAPRK